MTWNRDVPAMNAVSHPTVNDYDAIYSFDLKIKDDPSVLVGTQLPNTAATYDELNFNWRP